MLVKPKLQFLPMATVMERVSYSRRQLYRMIALGEFPKPVQRRGGKKNLFRSDEIDAWMDSPDTWKAADAR